MEPPSDEPPELTVKDYAGILLQKIELIAKPLLKPFSHDSDPISIYEEDLEPLKRLLARVRAALKDSHRSVMRGEYQKLWVSELRELEWRSEDIVEEIQFQALKKQELAEYKSELRRKRISSKRKREELEVGIFFSSSSVKTLAHRIKKLRELYYQIAFDKEALSLSEEGVQRSQPCCSLRPPTSSIMSGNFHGRKNDVKEVIRLLISNDDNRHDISVVPIDGMGGVGKTALVQRVFSDAAVISHFDKQIWICISEGLDLVKVTKSIREALRMETCCPSELDLLQQDVMSQLKGKRLLLVLDDLWNHEHWERHWKAIQLPLKVASKGSKIVVTTRNSKVAELITGADQKQYHLRSLCEDECWSIFKQHAFCGELSSIDPNLIQIGKEINQKCKGLPSAAKVFGGLLHGMLNEERWRRVLEELWSREECRNEIMADLKLSYDDLPMHLQRCFLYCSLFPKDYIFNKDHLSRLWMAQGFVELDGGMQLKEATGKYFDELAARSFFQQYAQSHGSDEKRYVMHDVYGELAQCIADLECKRSEDGVLCEINERTQHSSLILDNRHIEKGVQFEFSRALDLRTLLFVRRNERIERVFPFVTPRFELLLCLRALDLSYTDIDHLPPSIGSLIHLRYLGLGNTQIKRLPESICGLFKLQTLDLKQCHHLCQLPDGVKFLSELQLLQLPSRYRNEKVSGLQILRSAVIVYDQPDDSDTVFKKKAPIFKGYDTVDRRNVEMGVVTDFGNVCCSNLASTSSSMVCNQ